MFVYARRLQNGCNVADVGRIVRIRNVPHVSTGSGASEAGRRTIALIVGAGASIPAGAPSTRELLDTVLSAFPTEFVTIDVNRNETRRPVPLAALLQERIQEMGEGEADFELVMACLEEMISYNMPGRVLPTFTQPRASFEAVLVPGMLQAAYESAIRAIVMTFHSRVRRTLEGVQAALSLTHLVRALAGEARIVLSTLNYDTLLDDALFWFDGFTSVPGWGFAEFEPLLWLEQEKNHHLLMHLHGSMRFGFRPAVAWARATPFSEPVQYPSIDLAADSVFRSSTGSPSADGLLLPATPIIAGGHKSPKLLHNVRPYAYYNATALREIANADALLIIGYGFRDEHVNVWIDEYMRVHPDRPVAVITRRTGIDVGTSTAVERFLVKLSRGLPAYDQIFEPVNGGAQSVATHGRFGSAYVATAGIPLESDAASQILAYLRNETGDGPATAGTELSAYFGRRARVLRKDASTLVGTVQDVGGDRIGVAGRRRARQIRCADVISIQPVSDDVPDTD